MSRNQENIFHNTKTAFITQTDKYIKLFRNKNLVNYLINFSLKNRIINYNNKQSISSVSIKQKNCNKKCNFLLTLQLFRLFVIL